nr:mucin-2-like [Penaeus vannamei]
MSLIRKLLRLTAPTRPLGSAAESLIRALRLTAPDPPARSAQATKLPHHRKPHTPLIDRNLIPLIDPTSYSPSTATSTPITATSYSLIDPPTSTPSSTLLIRAAPPHCPDPPRSVPGRGNEASTPLIDRNLITPHTLIDRSLILPHRPQPHTPLILPQYRTSYSPSSTAHIPHRPLPLIIDRHLIPLIPPHMDATSYSPHSPSSGAAASLPRPARSFRREQRSPLIDFSASLPRPARSVPPAEATKSLIRAAASLPRPARSVPPAEATKSLIELPPPHCPEPARSFRRRATRSRSTRRLI